MCWLLAIQSFCCDSVACSSESRAGDVQAVKQFMESEEVLSSSVGWSSARPHRTSVFTGLLKSVKKLAGAEPRIPTPSQVESGSGQSEHDLVRQMAEIYISRKALHDNPDPVRSALCCACCPRAGHTPAFLPCCFVVLLLLLHFCSCRFK